MNRQGEHVVTLPYQITDVIAIAKAVYNECPPTVFETVFETAIRVYLRELSESSDAAALVHSQE